MDDVTLAVPRALGVTELRRRLEGAWRIDAQPGRVVATAGEAAVWLDPLDDSAVVPAADTERIHRELGDAVLVSLTFRDIESGRAALLRLLREPSPLPALVDLGTGPRFVAAADVVARLESDPGWDWRTSDAGRA